MYSKHYLLPAVIQTLLGMLAWILNPGIVFLFIVFVSFPIIIGICNWSYLKIVKPLSFLLWMVTALAVVPVSV